MIYNTPLSNDDRNMGMLCHLLALSGFVGIPFGHILGPLIIWLVKKETVPFVDDQGKQVLNFQISMSIYLAISAVFAFLTCGVGFVLTAVLAVANVILTIIGAVRATSGEYYRYPMSITFLS